MSYPVFHGPENWRRCREPSVPGAGLKKACPLKGAAPSLVVPRPSLLIAPGETKYGPVAVQNRPVIASS